MPEGDTIARAARVLRARLLGRTLTVARPAALARLAGRSLLGVEAAGKHLYMRFGDGLVLHTHMRMTGSWHVYDRGERWRRAPHRATAVLEFDDVTAVLFAAPVCELIAESRVGAGLGPDILAERFDSQGVLSRVRDEPRATIAEAMLDQSACAGIGNIHRCEALWHERIDPLARTADLDDATVMRAFARARDLMRRSVVSDAFRAPHAVHGRAGRPCRACGTAIATRSIGRPARLLYWCPACQAPAGITPRAAPTR